MGASSTSIPAELREHAKRVATLMAAFDKQLAPAAVLVYARALADLELAALDGAVARLIATAIHFPRVAEIRAEALGATGRDLKSEALEAWGEVKRRVSSHGAGREPTWSDPGTAFAVRAIGWRDYCLSDTSTEMSWRARFVDAYAGYWSRANERVQLGAAPARPQLRGRNDD